MKKKLSKERLIVKISKTMTIHSILITCLILGFIIIAFPIKTNGLKRGGVRCGQRTLLCPCGPLDNKQIAINIIHCYTKTNTCEPCDRISDSVKCRIYEFYCNQNTNRPIVPYNKISSATISSLTGAPCSCQNGGTCVKDSENTCICSAEFEGIFCEIHRLSQTEQFLQTETEPSPTSNSAEICEIPYNPHAGYIVYESQPIIPGEYIRYMCSDGYELYGNVTRYCLESGKFSGVAPTCEKVCRIPDMNYNRLSYEINPRHLKENELVDRFGNVMITEIQFSCQDNFQLEGPSLIRCSNGVWDNSPPSCKWYGPACKVPVIQSQMIIQEPEMNGGSVIPESVFRYRCKDRAVMQGDSIIVCTYSGTWVPQPPTCLNTASHTSPTSLSSSSCPIPKDPENGSIRLSIGINAYRNPEYQSGNSVVPVRTQVIYSCGEAYQLTTSQPIRTCLPDGRWNGRELPQCIPECGKTKEPKSYYIVNGSPITIDKWPWQVGLYRYADNGVFCGGSVLNERWVLTAAHCVTIKLDGGTLQQLKYEAYGVFFGQTTSKLDPTHKDVVTRKIWFVTYHQDYNVDTGDSDIALIYLETPLTFSNKIRPVCLPDVKSALSDITNSAGIIAGWGQTNPSIDNISLQLRYIHVKMVPNDVCKKSNVDENGFPAPITQNMFCAEGENVGSGTCHGDSGGSLCVITGPPADEVFQIEGIVSFGGYTGCAAPGQYDGFTRVRNFIDWIQSYI